MSDKTPPAAAAADYLAQSYADWLEERREATPIRKHTPATLTPQRRAAIVKWAAAELRVAVTQHTDPVPQAWRSKWWRDKTNARREALAALLDVLAGELEPAELEVDG